MKLSELSEANSEEPGLLYFSSIESWVAAAVGRSTGSAADGDGGGTGGALLRSYETNHT